MSIRIVWEWQKFLETANYNTAEQDNDTKNNIKMHLKEEVC